MDSVEHTLGIRWASDRQQVWKYDMKNRVKETGVGYIRYFAK